MTNAAIDRLVHHAIILELNATSYRAEIAQKNLIQASKVNKKQTKKKEDVTV